MGFLCRNLGSNVKSKFVGQKFGKCRSLHGQKDDDLEFGNPYEYLTFANDTSMNTLSNGIGVAIQRTNSPMATIGVYLKAGSAYENDDNNGLTYFFKEASLTPARSLVIPRFESVGARVVGQVGREISSFVCSSLGSDTATVIDLLGQVVTNKAFHDESVENARGNALRHKAASEADFESLCYEYAHSSGFQGSGLANPITGSRRVLQNINSEDLTSWSDHFISSGNLLIVAVGDVDHDQVLKEAEKSFGSIPKEPVGPLPYKRFVESIGSEIRIHDNTISHVHGTHAVESVGWNDINFFTFNILQYHFGSWHAQCGGGNCLSPELSETVADENLAVQFKTFNFSYFDTGLFGIYYQSDYDRADEMVATISHEYFRTTNMSEREVFRARSNAISSYLRSIQTSRGLADDIAHQIIYTGSHTAPAEIVIRMCCTGASDVLSIAQSHFIDVDPILSNIGPIKYIPDYGTFRTRTTAI